MIMENNKEKKVREEDREGKLVQEKYILEENVTKVSPITKSESNKSLFFKCQDIPVCFEKGILCKIKSNTHN